MFSFFKCFLPALAMPFISAGLGFAAGPAAAADTLSPAARIDRLESQIEGIQLSLGSREYLKGSQTFQFAQNYNYGRPRANVGMGEEDPYDNGAPNNNGAAYNSAGAGEDPAGLEVRMSHIEEQIRQINGQIEQMQFAERKLEDQLKKFQQDVDFRFQDTSHSAARPQKRTELQDSETAPGPVPAATAEMELAPPAGPLRTSHKGDAFDPSADPGAPGAPHPLGSIASTATALPPPETKPSRNPPQAVMADSDMDADPNAPLDLSSGKRGMPPASSTPANMPPGFGTPAAPRQIPLTGTQAAPGLVPPPATQVATVPPVASPRDEFDSALVSYKQKEYETAEKGFSTFLQKNPKNRMAPDAIYYLGETYFKRNRPREAAEQYLKISTEYASSAHAPEAMLNLGRSLKALDAKEQACASFNQVTQKYPNASAWIKTTAEQEAKNLRC